MTRSEPLRGASVRGSCCRIRKDLVVSSDPIVSGAQDARDRSDKETIDFQRLENNLSSSSKVWNAKRTSSALAPRTQVRMMHSRSTGYALAQISLIESGRITLTSSHPILRSHSANTFKIKQYLTCDNPRHMPACSVRSDLKYAQKRTFCPEMRLSRDVTRGTLLSEAR